MTLMWGVFCKHRMTVVSGIVILRPPKDLAVLPPIIETTQLFYPALRGLFFIVNTDLLQTPQ